MRPMLANAAIHLNPQSAMRNMQHLFRRSNLELRGPRKDRNICPRSSRGVRSAPFPAQNPAHECVD
eukprot:9347072-Alexandrium_andersonii.AAC.1